MNLDKNKKKINKNNLVINNQDFLMNIKIVIKKNYC